MDGERILVTGGCGFIGSAVVRQILGETDAHVFNVDKLTYAAVPEAVASVAANARYQTAQVDIVDRDALGAVFAAFRPSAVIHLAAESHVDRSIDGPGAFIETNVVGTFRMLEAARAHWLKLAGAEKDGFRFLHVSTDEVFGSLGPDDPAFSETTPYQPNSPYSASKAASDHLVRAWVHTYGFPAIVTNCSNNYGPWQFPEKLIPLMIAKLAAGEPLPVYGRGENVRDWLFVEDHARAIRLALAKGRIGDTYCVGGRSERRNIDVVKTLCALMDEREPANAPHERLITYVKDRPGHDARYAIDASKIDAELGWAPSVTFEEGIAQTLDWYLANADWWRGILAGRYDGARLGTG